MSYPDLVEEMVLRLEEIIERWENISSYTGDISYDIAVEETYNECVNQLREEFGIDK
jgi:hypothetical protein